jgi:ABC-type uncharacterized transport system substrate-binding protein
MAWRIPFVLLFALMAGCATPPPPEPPPPPVKVEPAPQPVVSPKPVAPPPDVAVLVSSNIPAYRNVADELVHELGPRVKTWYLDGTKEGKARSLAEIEHSQRSQVVAIGMDAAQSIPLLHGRQVIFCQVFNYEDYRLPSVQRKGVGVLPSFDKTFAAWRRLSPGLSTVAIITGPGMTDYIRQAKKAAREEGITLVHRVVNSDKEFLILYKSLAGSVQGYWLWPDNRVLSGSVLREVMTFSVRNSKQVLVFSDELLMLGGLFSATSDYHDIAMNVLKRLKAAEGKRVVPGPIIEPLDEVNLRINPVMVKRFDIEIPEPYRKYLYAP